MTPYEAKQQARRERLEAAAARAERISQTAHTRARELLAPIPLGQPILTGHHSERGHRRTLARADAATRRGVQAAALAARLRDRAAAVGTAGVSSDDPEAPDKLRERIAALERRQAGMKAVNAAIRQGGTADEQVARLVALGLSDATARKALQPDYAGRIGVAAYALSNNAANIRRLKARLAELERTAGDTTTEEVVGAVRIVDHVEANRVQVIFPGKPAAEVRAALKGAGFRWTPSEHAWQRQRSNAARYHAKQVAELAGRLAAGEARDV